MPVAVSAVSTTAAANSRYAAGETVPITVTFNGAVNVSGTPQLALNDGGLANYTGGSGTSTLTFTYTVAAGQSAADLDYASTAALLPNGGTIQDLAGNAAVLTLPATGSDGLAARNVAVSLSDGFESGDFSAWPWQLSSAGASPADWTVEQGVVHAGSFAAQSGAIGADGSSTLSVTLSLSAGEFSFWRKVSSAAASGLLTFEIDGTAVGQWSGEAPWQESFYGISAGQHTFSWIYAKGAGTLAGSDAAWLDDVQFTPGTTLTVDGTPGNDQFSFAAGGPTLIVALNGEGHSFPAGEFSQVVFHGDGGSDTATLIGSPSGNSALLYANGSGQLDNSAAGYAVAVDGMTSIDVAGHAGDVAQFFNAPGSNTFYACADYNNSGQPLAGMLGSGYSNSASGFGANVGYATSGNDTASFFDAPGANTFYAYADYDNSGKPLAGMAGGGYSNAASGFGGNVGYATYGGSDTAMLFNAPGSNIFYANADYDNSGKPLAAMSGGGYSNAASGFAANVGYATSGSSDTALFFNAPGSNIFYANADYNNSGKPLAAMSGGGYSNAASGFAANVGYATSGSNDTALFFNAPGSNTFYAYADYSNSGKALAGMAGSGYSNAASGFGSNVGYATSGSNDTALFFNAPGSNTFYAYADYNNSGKPLAGMAGGGYSNMASGFGTNVGYATNGGNDTADLFDSPGNDSLYTDLAIARLYGNNYTEQASGFKVVNAFGTSGGMNSKGHGAINYQLNYFGNWLG